MNRVDVKNPFFRIEVESFDGKRKAALTENIQRLITTVAITEVNTTGEATEPNQLQIEFNQMHYLPEDGGLRPQDPKVFGELTNRPNAIVDLRFDSEKGFTFVSKEEMDARTSKSNRTQDKQQEPIVFLFQPHNVISVTWGYLEPQVARTRRFRIQSLDMTGDASSDGKLKIVAVDISENTIKTSPQKGVIFQTEQGEKLSLKQTLYKVSKSFDFTLIYEGEVVDKEPPNVTEYDKFRTKDGLNTDSLPPEKAFRIPKGMTYKQFLNKLAADFQSRVEFDTDVKNRQVVRFTKVETLYKTPVQTLTYKDANGLLKSFKINAMDAYGITKTNMSSVEEEQVKYVATQVSEAVTAVPEVFDKQEEKQIKDTLGTNTAGKSETIPTDDVDAIDQANEAAMYEGIYSIAMEFTTIGHPDFKPRAYTIENIGARYSGNYRAFSVTHTISSSGYECKFVAQRYDISEGGVPTSQYKDDNNGFVKTQVSEAQTEE